MFKQGIKLPPSNTRVEENTPPRVNEKIRAATERSVSRYAVAHGGAIHRRLSELDREWDIDRAMESSAAALACTGAILALTVNRRYAWVTVVAAGFLLQHALLGWCAPLRFFRTRGVRTLREINEEKTALRILHGDFKPAAGPADALRQVRRQ